MACRSNLGGMRRVLPCLPEAGVRTLLGDRDRAARTASLPREGALLSVRNLPRYEGALAEFHRVLERDDGSLLSRLLVESPSAMP